MVGEAVAKHTMATMAIPVLKSLEECADFSKTVEPYIAQFYELPQRLIASGGSPHDLLTLYKSTNPLVSGFAFSLFLGCVFLVVSEFNRNYSQVDRMWSLLPTIYNAHFAVWTHLNELPTQRVDLVLFWSVLWSARLTFNYWRKGGYTVGSEDYRWEIIRGQIHPVLFFVLNVTFISFIQSVLLFLMAAPTYAILLTSQMEPQATVADYGFAAVQVLLVISEWFSDQQQWDYQSAKKEHQESGKVRRGYAQADLERGFITSGLWAYSRHPNFAAEQTIWFVLYQWSCYASKVLYSWTGLGSMSLVLLFQGSTILTETISSGKYPEYKHYQKQIGAHIPSFTAYKPPGPKIIRTSELAKKQKTKQK